MPSDRQINANRRNAALGGPKTDKGRAAVKLNRVSHGLCAATPVLPGEDPEAFKQLRSNLFHEYQPATETERLLVEEFVVCSWRLVRLRRVETQTWTEYIYAMRRTAPSAHAPTQEQADRALAGALNETDPKKLVNFFRYERTITRDFYRILHELQAMEKERRRAERLPAGRPATDSAAVEPEPLAAAASAAATAAQAAEPAPQPAPATHDFPPATELSGNGIGTVSSPPEAAPPGEEQNRHAA